MPNDDRPPGGLRFWDAVREFSDPEFLAAHDRAQGVFGRPGVHSMPFGQVGQWTREYNADERAYQQSLIAVLGDFWALVKTTGDVIAIGCPGSVDEAAREILPGEWDWLPDRPGKDGTAFKGNGRTWYRVLFHRRKSRSSQRTMPTLVSVEMYSHANSPDGMLEPGHRYDLPKDVAEPLIASGAARMTAEQPSVPELDAPDPKYPGPWNEEAWRAGISLSDWGEWRDPEAWAQRRANWVPIVSLDSPSSYEEDQKHLSYAAAIRQLREHLRTDIEGGRIVLGKPPDSPFDDVKPVSQDALFEILEAVDFSPMRGDEVYFRGAWIELRVYRPERFAPVVAEAKSDQPGRDEDTAPAGGAADAIPHRTLETKIIDEYEKIFGEKDPPMTYVGYAKLIKDRIKYKGEVSNIERRLRMLRKDGKINNIK